MIRILRLEDCGPFERDREGGEGSVSVVVGSTTCCLGLLILAFRSAGIGKGEREKRESWVLGRDASLSTRTSTLHVVSNYVRTRHFPKKQFQKL
jgi:hypothetical protein